MHYQVDETESHVGGDGNMSVRARDLSLGRCREESLCLALCGLTHVSDWVIADLPGCEHGVGLVAPNACQQKCGEAIPHHHVLNQFAYRDSRRRRLLRRVRGQLAHNSFELCRSCPDQLHALQASGTSRSSGRRPTRLAWRDRSVQESKKGDQDCYVTNNLDTLLTSLYVKIDDELATGRRMGRPPQLTDAELVTLAVAQALLGFGSETRWLRYANSHMSSMFPYLAQPHDRRADHAVAGRIRSLKSSDLIV